VDGGTDTSHAPFAASWQAAGVIVHVFTHFELRLTVYRAQVPDGLETGADDGWWEPVTNLDAQALPTVMKKVIAQAIPSAFDESRKFR
jgi:A/G-specific adenine glycosylase